MAKMSHQITYSIRKVIEYSTFFVGERPIDVRATLKHFSRSRLIRAAAIFSHHYGNFSWPNSRQTLFSDISKKHFQYLDRLFQNYYKREHLDVGQKVEVFTYRTSLELWRLIFAIKEDEFTEDVEESDVEMLLFRVLLALNERVVNFNEREKQYQLDELLFLNGFLTNDSNRYDFNVIMEAQVYYFWQLVDYIPLNEVLSNATEKLFTKWGITSWIQYFKTILYLAWETDKYIKQHLNGVPVFKPSQAALEQDSDNIKTSLIDCLSIEEDAFFPFDEEVDVSSDLNVDYRSFRSKPIVKLKNGAGYIVINNQLLCERLFNSLYFDFSPLINGRTGSVGSFDYNKEFIEKTLFRNTFFSCIASNSFTFPRRKENDIEKSHEPDFYVRTKRSELIIVECKAIKMNGECRDDGDYARLLDELHEKIVLKTRNLDKRRKEYRGEPEQVGVGQLIHSINSIEDDSFEWDTNIPDKVVYYPMLVFEDVKLVQTGILSIVNRWFYEEIKRDGKIELSETAIMPIMVVSINTLYLYNHLLSQRGLCNVINDFVKETSMFDSSTGMYRIPPMADFDLYLRRNPFNKKNDVKKWIEMLKSN